MSFGFPDNDHMTVLSNILWFSSSLYQTIVLPLLCAVLALRGTKRTVSGVLYKLLELLICAAAAIAAYAIIRPMFHAITPATFASHGILLCLIAVYAAVRSDMPSRTCIVVVMALYAAINTVLSISHLLLSRTLSHPLAHAITFFLIAGSCFIIRRYRPQEEEPMPVSYWLSFLFMLLLSFICFFTVRVIPGSGYDENYLKTMAVILPTLFAAGLLAYYLYYALSTEHKRAQDLLAIQIRQSSEMELLHQTEALCRELHSLRHEFRNHCTAMDAFLREERFDRLHEYLTDYIGQIEKVTEDFFCENPLVYAVVTQAMSTAKAQGINIKTEIRIPAQIPLPDTDLCSLLGNLLINAVEGCQRAGGHEISLLLYMEKGFLFAIVTNPVLPGSLAQNPSLITTKKGPDRHGFGVPIIRRIAEAHNGCVEFHEKDGFFTADVMRCLE